MIWKIIGGNAYCIENGILKTTAVKKPSMTDWNGDKDHIYEDDRYGVCDSAFKSEPELDRFKQLIYLNCGWEYGTDYVLSDC